MHLLRGKPIRLVCAMCSGYSGDDSGDSRYFDDKKIVHKINIEKSFVELNVCHRYQCLPGEWHSSSIAIPIRVVLTFWSWIRYHFWDIRFVNETLDSDEGWHAFDSSVCITHCNWICIRFESVAHNPYPMNGNDVTCDRLKKWTLQSQLTQLINPFFCVNLGNYRLHNDLTIGQSESESCR